MFKSIPFLFVAVVASLQLNPNLASAQGKLGVSLVDLGNNRGALVTRVENGSAAQRLICPYCNEFHQMTPGVNVITHVNGRYTGTANEVVRAIGQSGMDVSLTIGSLQKSVSTTYKTRLMPLYSGANSSRAANWNTNRSAQGVTSYGQNVRRSGPRTRFGRWLQRVAEANPGGGSDYGTDDFQMNLDFLSNDSDDDDTLGYSNSSDLGNNFHLKLQRNHFNRNYSSNPDHRR